jgi:hypothetical protein
LFGNFDVLKKRCPFQYPKVPLEAGAPQSFDASYGPDYWHCTYTGKDRSALKYT